MQDTDTRAAAASAHNDAPRNARPPETNGDGAKDFEATARRLARHCAAYKGASTGRSLIQLLTTAVPFLGLCAAMAATVEQAYWLTLSLAIVAAGLMVRMFIIQHDCGHGSFFNSRSANDALGRLLSVITLTPYGYWRQSHARHHATSGNLDRRGFGDIDTLTVREYLGLPRLQRLRYRFYRNPLVLLGLGVPLMFIVFQRIPLGMCFPFRETWRSVFGLDAAIVLVYGLAMAAMGVGPFLLAYGPMILVAAWIGGWLFFVQHQYEETHWDTNEDWSFHVAALRGSSHYDLPRVLHWFTGNIGLHHIHHLCSGIPNYRLQKCLDDSPELQRVGRRLTLLESLKCVRLALWDEEARKLIGFGDLKRLAAC